MNILHFSRTKAPSIHNESGTIGKPFLNHQVKKNRLHQVKLFCSMMLVIGTCHAQQIKFSKQEKTWLSNSIKELDKSYDPKEKMLTKKIEGWNYHTDSSSGNFHDTRASLFYAIKLMDYGGKENINKAVDIIESTIALQDTVRRSGTRGVWPYFKEEPLATKKSPVDYNWADFNAVSLLDIWMEHQNELPADLKPKMQKAILLAAQAIQKRNVGPSYTNIAIMGTYVTYMTAELFNQKEMLQYAQKRLNNFYDYTVKRGGFEEYNSPTYTIVALDELNRMQRHIKEPSALVKIDSLYSLSWNMIARHYHKPTGQWVGPHSRAYSPVVDSLFPAILYKASGGKVGAPSFTGDVKTTHKIPPYLLHYFLKPNYPRTESDVFITSEPQVKGTAYMTQKYAIATANRASLWNQRHPLLIYWGTDKKPQYCQLRLLHDFYDFSSASFYSAQDKNKVLAGINFITNGGDKHISIDRIKNGQFKASDLRLRFEFPVSTTISNLQLPNDILQPFGFMAGDLPFYIQPYKLAFGDLKGKWETGRDGTKAWIDFVIYSGDSRDFNLSEINTAFLGFALTIDETLGKGAKNVKVDETGNDQLNVQWNNLQLQVGTKPTNQPPNL
ncbi:hypothetical protein [Flavobacterium gilvum]|uniref:Uncharacterized protein n=1 Tax=Flavobacterium gilvum TaxID=1492737 RepID=A0AAC9I6W9_9FLAO|nr:hypothetical protein [Flavobacterium gilvum]AOW09017.1 hypothetical protein EM308_05560 [Flavobacterium gilvum]KFC60560.1 hypothetical protein FEM08_06020 [Flavobacterium gilvum]